MAGKLSLKSLLSSIANKCAATNLALNLLSLNFPKNEKK